MKDEKFSNSVRVQIRLHRQMIREADAVEVLEYMRGKGKTDREIIREALVVLGEKLIDGFEPVTEVGEAKLTAKALTLLENINSVVQQLATMDFSGVVGTDGNPVNAEQIRRELNALDQSASEMLGQAIFFDIEGDE